MKQKDIVVIAIVIVMSAIFSLVVSNLIFGTPTSRQLQAEDVSPISDVFLPADSNYTKYINKDALNPTKVITIGNNSNNQPFNGAGQ